MKIDEKDIEEKIVRLNEYLKKNVVKPFRLRINNNSRTIISVKRSGIGYNISIHSIFLEADEDIILALSAFINNPRVKPPELRDFINENHSCESKKKRTEKIHEAGRYFNLREIFDRINKEYFQNKINSSITWRKGIERRFKKLSLGSYSYSKNRIYINSLLDREGIPNYFIDFVVYHEMIHALIGFEEKNGKKYAHTKAFRELEKRFYHYERAKKFERNFFKTIFLSTTSW